MEKKYRVMFTNYSAVTEDCSALLTAVTEDCSALLKSTCFAVIRNALATASIRPHLNARPPDSEDSSFVMMYSFFSSACRASASLSRTTTQSAFVANERKLSIEGFCGLGANVGLVPFVGPHDLFV